MTPSVEITGTLISGLIKLALENLKAEQREALAALKFHPVLPNTFSLAAALSVGGMDYEMLDGFCTAGLLEQPSYARFGIKMAVAQKLKMPDAGIKRGLTYYRRYLDAHRYELNVLTPEVRNLVTALEFALLAGSTAAFAEMTRDIETLLVMRGEYELCERLVRDALEGMSKSNETEGVAAANMRAELMLSLAKVKIKQGDANEAKTSALAGLVLAQDVITRSALLGVLGNSQMVLGELNDADATLKEGTWLVPAGSSYVMTELLQNHGVVATRLGRYNEAERYTRDGLALARECEDHAMETALLCNLGVLHYHRGEFDDALATYDEGLQLAEKIGFIEKQAALLSAKGGTLLPMKRSSEAEAYIRKALALAQVIQHRWYVVLCYKELGLALLDQDRNREAEEAFRCALTASTHGARDIEAYAHWGLAQVYEKLGEIFSALIEAEQSVAGFRAMNHHMTRQVTELISRLQTSLK